MPLPLLPGLQSGAPAPSDDTTAAPSSALADFLNGLDDSQIQELSAAADAYVAANPDDAATEGEEGESGDTIPSPAPDDAPPADDADPDAPAPEEGEEDGMEAGGQDLDAVATHASADVEEGASSISAMQELADSDSESAPIVAKLVAVAAKLQQSLEKSQKLVDKAVSKEDVQGAAQAGINCHQFLEGIQALEQAARTLGTSIVAPAATPQDHPSLKVWSAVVQKKLPGLAL